MYYIVIDLGTSAVKLLLMDETGSIANIVSREYPIAFPHPGWSEQDPADWWAAVCDGIPALLDGFDASQVKGIGAGGQMHGLVVLDKNDTVIRPCILWNDGRTQSQVDYLYCVIGKIPLGHIQHVCSRRRNFSSALSNEKIHQSLFWVLFVGVGVLDDPL